MDTAAGVEISGIIVNAATRQPVEKVYLYTIKGEEEAVSDASGHFRFISWQERPLKIYISHSGYRQKLVLVQNDLKNLRIEIVQQ